VLDARVDAPEFCMTLTTATPWEQLDPAVFRNGMARVVARLRRLYGRCEYFAAVEFTTGTAARSGGHRRMHAHALLKVADRGHRIDAHGTRASDAGRGSPVFDVVDVGPIVRETWERATGAYIVDVAQLVSPGAALGYLGLHHRKPSQAPPAAWRGMTERASRAYWSTPIAQLRDVARAELAAEAIAHRTGLSVELAALELAARGPSHLIDTTKRDDAELRAPLVGWRPNR
jgi:hypothetical protein